ncbi:hypothetical protein GCM10010082_26570 [Kushneria pakistanensis]|uniref:N-acetyltransferase domain-containing protein n=2 Tax=Kushneria pakistanensis TaxID=1508770 RepID=A0ABQ3FP62_9GAMM|nr:hypothetical protein GCM10010082_26570 [Kushneria pakistanensis]
MNVAIFTAVTDPEALRHMATLFLAKDFQKANYIQVAEVDETLCGVLIGTTEKVSQSALEFNAEPWVEASEEALKRTAAGRQVLHDLEGSSDPTLMPKSTVLSDCDSELVFFSSALGHRRCGIGSQLVRNFEAFLKACGARKYYLYSDSLCTYQFYDNNGYQRVEQKQNTFDPCIENYTYTKKVNE